MFGLGSAILRQPFGIGPLTLALLVGWGRVAAVAESAGFRSPLAYFGDIPAVHAWLVSAIFRGEYE